jgi:methionyl-tRNA synthetase
LKYFLTTAIPYVNGVPHVGHSLEYFQADAIRRYHQLLGEETLLLSGADENALKNVQAAEKEGLPINEYLDKYSKIWHDTYELLGVHLDVFQRGSDKDKHWPGVQKLWKLCINAGDIYKKSYEGLYCIGCEAFKTEGELVNELCPEHQTKPEKVSEENYFFKLSKYQDQLVELIESDKLKIIPANKRQEALSFIKSGLEDFSVSRSNERAKGVGVPVPGDDNQKIYVWFDALNIYMTGVGFGTDEEKWKKFWPTDLHIIGKDINRFHTVYWPAMLLSAGLPLPKQILIHGFVNLKGEKISKSTGNVIAPRELVEEFGLEPLRYFMLSQPSIDGDYDFTIEKFKEIYNADLANGLGNLVARVAKLCESHNVIANAVKQSFDPKMTAHLEEYRFNEALAYIWGQITEADKKVNEEKPWELEGEQVKLVLEDLIKRIQIIAFNLQPFLPETAEKILKQFSGEIQSSAPLFPRI